jgi:DNA-binding transcriptional ArsR family regulator
MAQRGQSTASERRLPAQTVDAAPSRRVLEHRATVIKALAHPSRLAMVDALAQGEKCVCHLRALVGADMSTVSKHLSLLRNAGIVLSEKRGLQVFYRLRVPCLLSFFSCVDAVFENPDAELVQLLPRSRGRGASETPAPVRPAGAASRRNQRSSYRPANRSSA